VSQQKEVREVNGLSDRDRHLFLAYDDACRDVSAEKGYEEGTWYGRIAPVKQGQSVRGVSIE
jgi:hypothetical protein